MKTAATIPGLSVLTVTYLIPGSEVRGDHNRDRRFFSKIVLRWQFRNGLTMQNWHRKQGWCRAWIAKSCIR